MEIPWRVCCGWMGVVNSDVLSSGCFFFSVLFLSFSFRRVFFFEGWRFSFHAFRKILVKNDRFRLRRLFVFFFLEGTWRFSGNLLCRQWICNWGVCICKVVGVGVGVETKGCIFVESRRRSKESLPSSTMRKDPLPLPAYTKPPILF